MLAAGEGSDRSRSPIKNPAAGKWFQVLQQEGLIEPGGWIAIIIEGRPAVIPLCRRLFLFRMLHGHQKGKVKVVPMEPWHMSIVPTEATNYWRTLKVSEDIES
jgi:hypothetical protein